MSSPMPSLRLFASLVLLCTLTGCFHTMAPTRPKILAPAITSYPASDYKTDVAAYRAAIGKPDYVAARVLRDQIVYRTLADIESAYGRFEVQLTTSRATESVLADTAELGLTAASTVVAASDVKDILTASLSGLQGTQLSFDKNFFREKTTESLISQMRADRKNLEAQIITRLATQDVIPTTDQATKANIAAYPLDAAWIDVTQYYYAGTVPSALVSIATTTGNNATKAATNLTNTVNSLIPPTAAQLKTAKQISDELLPVFIDASGSDTTKSTAALKKITAILTDLNLAPATNASTSDIVAALKTYLSSTDKDKTKLVALQAAVEKEK